MAAAAAFVSNVFFWRTSGYFDRDAETLPLLHTWSLAVEEQFYIGFPFFVFAIYRVGRRWLKPAVALTLLASLAFDIHALRTHPGAAFYLAPGRAWELLIGSFVALGGVPRLPTRAAREAAAAGGVILVAASLLLYSRSPAFPGAAALLPCVGTAAVIHAGADGEPTWTGRAISNPLFVATGLASYSLYLWHWPMLVFARYAFGGAPASTATLLAVVGAAVASALSWRFVEEPFRRRTRLTGRRPLFVAAAALTGSTLLAGVVVGASNGFPSRLSGYARPAIPGREFFREHECFLSPDDPPKKWAGAACKIEGGARKTALLWGDSFAAHFVPGLTAHAKDLHADLLQYNLSSCPPVRGSRVPDSPYCEAFNENVEHVLRDYDVSVVVVAARWQYYQHFLKVVSFDQIQATTKWLESKGVRVVLIGPSPWFVFENPYDQHFLHGGEFAETKLGFTELELRRFRDAAGDATFVDPFGWACDAGGCRYLVGNDYTVFDSGHYSVFGSKLVVEKSGLVDAINAALDR
jgi:hypothetical protein